MKGEIVYYGLAWYLCIYVFHCLSISLFYKSYGGSRVQNISIIFVLASSPGGRFFIFDLLGERMAITKKQKTELMSAYTDDLKQAQNVVLVKQLGLPVNDFNRLRMGVVEAGGKVAVIRKTLFNRVIEQEGFEPGGMMDSEGSIFALYAIEKEFDPMKVIVTSQKLYKKGQKKFTVDFVGGWFDKQWKDGAYVSELANLPTKPELVAKFLFLLKYPVQSFVMTLDQISKKNAS